MFAAKRKKDTALWTSVPELRTHLERKCDDSHPHLKWGQTSTGFATAEECAYNDSMSSAWAEAIFDFALKRDYFAPPTTVQEATSLTSSSTYINKAILGCLPRGRKMLPMMSEHLQPQLFDISHLHEVQQLPLGKRIPDSCNSFPKGSKLLRFCNVDGGTDVTPKLGLPCHAMVGIPRTPDDFLKEACKLTHPTAMAMTVGDVMLRNIDLYNEETGLGFRKLQCNFAKQLLSMCEGLKMEERECRRKMDGHVEQVLGHKRIVLFKRLLEEISYPDVKIADEMAAGFPLCGWMPASGVFPTRIRPPEIPESFLRKMARSFSARSLAVTKSSGCPEADSKLWEATLEEVSDGFLEGPLEADCLGPESVVSPRFGLQQKSKLRPIDNFSASQVNSATGLQDKFSVESVDEICAMIKAWMQRAGPGLKLVGKTFDMRKAYRQIAINKQHLDFSWIAVWNPVGGKPAIFRMRTMPFGATASVAAFLRISQAIKTLGIACGGLVWTSFYDDFVCVCPQGAEQQTDRMVRLLFKSLGWTLSEDPDKDKPFAEVFQALGVEFDLRHVAHGKFYVSNTESRRTELKEKIGDILQADMLEPTTAESLRSRLLFADAQLFGRFSKMALHRIGDVALRRRPETPLNDQTKDALNWFVDRILTGPPRCVTCHNRPTFFLFLDGACSERTSESSWSGTSVGAVLADSSGNLLHFFGLVVDEAIVATWGRPDQTQHVFEAEVLPYAMALTVWGKLLRGSCLFAFIDNEAAKASWIAGFAYSPTARQVIHQGTLLEAKLNVSPFFSRVPTSSNYGDDPSRGRFAHLERMGAQRTHAFTTADLDPSATEELYTVDDTPLKACGEIRPRLRLGGQLKEEAQVTFQVVEGVNENILSVNRALDVMPARFVLVLQNGCPVGQNGLFRQNGVLLVLADFCSGRLAVSLQSCQNGLW
eukprot:s2092_g5.t1